MLYGDTFKKRRGSGEKLTPEQIKNSLVKQAKTWFLNFGILPEKFFAQSLKSYLRVLLFEDEDDEQLTFIDEIGW